jgi:hypothetical protein
MAGAALDRGRAVVGVEIGGQVISGQFTTEPTVKRLLDGVPGIFKKLDFLIELIHNVHHVAQRYLSLYSALIPISNQRE